MNVDLKISLPQEVYDALVEFTSLTAKKTKQSITPESSAVGLIIVSLVQGKYLKVKDVRKLGVKI